MVKQEGKATKLIGAKALDVMLHFCGLLLPRLRCLGASALPSSLPPSFLAFLAFLFGVLMLSFCSQLSICAFTV